MKSRSRVFRTFASWAATGEAESVAASPGPPVRKATASFAAPGSEAGRTTKWMPILRPFRASRSSHTCSVPQRAGPSTPLTLQGFDVRVAAAEEKLAEKSNRTAAAIAGPFIEPSKYRVDWVSEDTCLISIS